jgi:multiple sugar transport system permease protein
MTTRTPREASTPLAVQATSIQKRRWSGLTHRQQLALMLAPYLVGMIILTIIPTLTALPLAFTSYNAIEAPRYIGLGNFRELGNDTIFWQAVRNSLVFILLASPLRLVGALSFALLMNRAGTSTAISRALVYLPTVVPDIAWALVWLWIFNPLFGPLNQLLGIFGIAGPAWGVDAWPARFAVVIMVAWQLGEGFVISLAALQDVPQELHEQAAVDGASSWQTFWRVTLPLISPIMLIFLMRDTIHSLQANFVPALIVTRGGPNYATTYLPLYIYTNAFDYLRFGYAAAMTWALFIITGLVIFIQYRIAVRWRLGFSRVD